MSGIFKLCITELAGSVTMRLPIFLHAESGGIRLQAINGEMDGWIQGWLDEKSDGCMDGWMHGWMDGWTGGEF